MASKSLLSRLFGRSKSRPCDQYQSLGERPRGELTERYQYSNYNQYVESQIEGNKRKLETVWTSSEEMRQVADYIKTRIPSPKFGICHGVKKGVEVQQLKAFLEAEIIGTEISDNASDYDGVICWDFNKVKPEWVGSVDFIYTNSFDHAFDPEVTLDAWMSCLSEHGICFIEWTEGHDVPVDEIDPFRAGFSGYFELFKRTFDVAHVIHVPKHENTAYPLPRFVFCVQNRAAAAANPAAAA